MKKAPFLFISTLMAVLLISDFRISEAQDVTPVSPYDFPYGYPFPDYPLAGASPPAAARDYMSREPSMPNHFTKRVAQYALRLIQTDRIDEAIEYANRFMTEYPRLMDEEVLFMRAMAQAQKGYTDEAVESLNQAIKNDLPPQRFLAGPRRMFTPIHDHPVFVNLMKKHEYDLVHGPMLGAVTDKSVKVWVRTAIETPVRIVLSTSADMSAPIVSQAVMSKADDDYTAVVPVEDLVPDTRYYYSVVLGHMDNTSGSGQAGMVFHSREIRAAHQTFKTNPLEGQNSRFQVVFGGCAGYVPYNERIWDVIRRFEPQAFLTLGDNVYIDDPESPDQQRLMYYKRQSRPEFRRLVGSTPVYSIWDDHDFGMDDSEGGPEADLPYWKPMVLDIFKQNWVNPSYGNTDRPGIWFDFEIGDVHFIMLDGRYYREDAGRWSSGERIANASMLGPHQKEWLKKTLTESEATFKVLVSPVPWKYDAKGSGVRRLDGWYGYSEEREEIFSWIEDQNIEGVVLVSSDRHRSDAWLIERENGYNFYEFNSGHFTNEHTHDVMEGSLIGFNDRNSFGLLTFDTVADDPAVTYQIVDINGFVHETLKVKMSQLKH
jgi:alkaline phosphatase D